MRNVLLIVLTMAMAAGAEETRVAHIGLELDGSWSWIEEVKAQPSVLFAGIAEANEELRARARKGSPGVAVYADWRAMLDEAKPQAVTVTVPNRRHLEIVRECAKRKISVWFQKPLAASGGEARKMERVAREAGITLMASYHTLWSGPMRAFMKKLPEAGTVRYLEVRHSFPASKVLSPFYERQFLDPAQHGGGALMDQGTYGLAYAAMILGRPMRVFATGRTLRPRPGLRMEDDATVVLDYPGATAVIRAGWWAEPDGAGEGFTRVAGARGELVRDMGKVTFTRARGTAESVEVEALPAHQRGGIAQFLASVRSGKAVEAPHSATMNVLVNEIVDAAYESMRTGRAVEMR